MRKVHRIVILPDYQGIGLGKRFLKIIAEIYVNKNEYFGITTNLNSFARSLLKDKNFYLIRTGKVSKQSNHLFNTQLSFFQKLLLHSFVIR